MNSTQTYLVAQEIVDYINSAPLHSNNLLYKKIVEILDGHTKVVETNQSSPDPSNGQKSSLTSFESYFKKRYLVNSKEEDEDVFQSSQARIIFYSEAFGDSLRKSLIADISEMVKTAEERGYTDKEISIEIRVNKNRDNTGIFALVKHPHAHRESSTYYPMNIFSFDHNKSLNISISVLRDLNNELKQDNGVLGKIV